MLEPLPSSRVPALISDGGGLPFAPGELTQPPGGLDQSDPAAQALIAQLSGRSGARRAPWKRGSAPTSLAPPPSFGEWRLLARTDDEVLFGRGRPPRLHTAAFRRDPRRGTWAFIGESAGRPLRAARDGIRASSWRIDPTLEGDPDATVLRILVTEQTYAGGKRADGRVLAPDIHIDADELLLRIFVTPQQGFQMRSPNPETPVRVALAHPVGQRRLIDGAVYDQPADSSAGVLT